MAAADFYNNSIFWIEIDKIRPNPYQPRKEFNEAKLAGLADSIRQYGVLQPLVATRHEEATEGGGMAVTYELIAGERRLRASKLAGLSQVPLTIRTGDDQNRTKLELAIIENIQREDLNPIDRARAFQRLVDEFGFKHTEIGRKVGKSREYVSNSIRLLMLSEEMQSAVSAGKISEGHARPLMMLIDRPEEQSTLFKEILLKKLTVREAESIARRIAQDKVRKKNLVMIPELIELEKELTETLGTRVQIEQREVGGKITIDYFSPDDLRSILNQLQTNNPSESGTDGLLSKLITRITPQDSVDEEGTLSEDAGAEHKEQTNQSVSTENPPKQEEKSSDDEEDLYSLKNFTI